MLAKSALAGQTWSDRTLGGSPVPTTMRQTHTRDYFAAAIFLIMSWVLRPNLRSRVICNFAAAICAVLTLTIFCAGGVVPGVGSTSGLRVVIGFTVLD